MFSRDALAAAFALIEPDKGALCARVAKNKYITSIKYMTTSFL